MQHSDPQKVPDDVFHVSVVLPDSASARAFVARRDIDFGCRPSVRRSSDGSLITHAILSGKQVGELRGQRLGVTVLLNATVIGRERQAEVGKGDRFQGGRIAPKGLGRKHPPPVDSKK